MDPITHTLVGACLAETPLRRWTRLAAPALVIGANLPDVDILSYAAGSDAALGFRRGWTHGVLALAVLPVLLAGALWILGRRRQAADPALSLRGLLGLSYLAVLSHPALDWLNTYGMRWWMPFDDTWFYGDAVFIVDPWLWLVLGITWLVTRQRSMRGVILFAFTTATALTVLGSRAPGYLGLVAVVVVTLFAAYVWRPPEGRLGARLPVAALALAAGYITTMLVLQSATERRVRAQLSGLEPVLTTESMVGPTPANPLLWDVVARSGNSYLFGTFDWRSGRLALDGSRLQAARPTSSWRVVVDSGQVPGFVGWARFPWVETASAEPSEPLYVMDARYARKRTTSFGGAVVRPVEGD